MQMTTEAAENADKKIVLYHRPLKICVLYINVGNAKTALK